MDTLVILSLSFIHLRYVSLILKRSKIVSVSLIMERRKYISYFCNRPNISSSFLLQLFARSMITENWVRLLRKENKQLVREVTNAADLAQFSMAE